MTRIANALDANFARHADGARSAQSARHPDARHVRAGPVFDRARRSRGDRPGRRADPGPPGPARGRGRARSSYPPAPDPHRPGPGIRTRSGVRPLPGRDGGRQSRPIRCARMHVVEVRNIGK